MQIITHRWLEPLNNNFKFIESSKEAFINHLERWYWLEFDINFSKDMVPFIFHDWCLERITNWKDKRNFDEINIEEILSYNLNWNSFISFEELVKNISKYRKDWEYSALHLKSKFQEEKYIDVMLDILNKYENIESKIFIFDVKIETAQYLKSKNKNIKLFPSISHKYDIERYNSCTGNTLYSIEDFLDNLDIFDWVWLDEWDRKDIGWEKTLYNKEVFNIIKKENKLIGLVTPELHAKSPWLLWWEAHEDCKNLNILKSRFKEIVDLNPDFICSDYLEFIK